MKREKSFPTILGLVVLVGSLIGGVFLTQTNRNPLTKASGDCQPVNLQITNITHQSAAISYITSADCLSNLSIDNRTISDMRFEVNSTDPVPTKIHYFQVFNLKQSTEYNFTLINGGQSISESSYKFTTASKPSGDIPQSNLAWGKIFTPELAPASNVILYFNIPGASPLSSYVTSQGNWNISLAYSFNDAKTNWFNLPSSAVDEDIIVIDEKGSATQITNSSDRNNPVPDIIIGQNFLSETPLSPPDSGQIPDTTSTNSSTTLDILNPKDGESINTVKPYFFGSAPQNSEVIITVESPETFTGQATSDSSGSWNWSLPGNLTPGEHTITVKTQNPTTGLWETISKKFYVLAGEGDSLAFTATPSATTVPASPTPTSAIPSPTVKLTSTPTPVPTLVPTAVPTAVRVSQPSTSSGIPVTGNTVPTLLIITFGVISFIIARRFL